MRVSWHSSCILLSLYHITSLCSIPSPKTQVFFSEVDLLPRKTSAFFPSSCELLSASLERFPSPSRALWPRVYSLHPPKPKFSPSSSFTSGITVRCLSFAHILCVALLTAFIVFLACIFCVYCLLCLCTPKKPKFFPDSSFTSGITVACSYSTSTLCITLSTAFQAYQFGNLCVYFLNPQKNFPGSNLPETCFSVLVMSSLFLVRMAVATTFAAPILVAKLILLSTHSALSHVVPVESLFSLSVASHAVSPALLPLAFPVAMGTAGTPAVAIQSVCCGFYISPKSLPAVMPLVGILAAANPHAWMLPYSGIYCLHPPCHLLHLHLHPPCHVHLLLQPPVALWNGRLPGSVQTARFFSHLHRPWHPHQHLLLHLHLASSPAVMALVVITAVGTLAVLPNVLAQQALPHLFCLLRLAPALSASAFLGLLSVGRTGTCLSNKCGMLLHLHLLPPLHCGRPFSQPWPPPPCILWCALGARACNTKIATPPIVRLLSHLHRPGHLHHLLFPTILGSTLSSHHSSPPPVPSRPLCTRPGPLRRPGLFPFHLLLLVPSCAYCRPLLLLPALPSCMLPLVLMALLLSSETLSRTLVLFFLRSPPGCQVSFVL